MNQSSNVRPKYMYACLAVSFFIKRAITLNINFYIAARYTKFENTATPNTDLLT